MNWLLLSLLLSAGESGAEPVDFDTQIEPLLTRYGCNAGSCHGAAAGRGGFSLSLYGSVPEHDFEVIVQQLEGRRVNLSAPEQSLLFLKATESLPHGGGPRFDTDSPAAALLLNWIRAGARRPDSPPRTLQDLQAVPGQIRLSSPGESRQLRIEAAFSDESRLDVTAWCVLTAEDDSALDISHAGMVTATRPGRHVLTVRYLDRLIPVEVLVPFRPTKSSAAGAETQPDTDPRATAGNRIDRAILLRLRELELAPASLADAGEFLRRASLRLTGRLPAEDEFIRFSRQWDRQLEETTGEHPDPLGPLRTALIDQLLASDSFVDFWTSQFVRLLKVRTQPQPDGSARTAYTWIRRQIAADRPMDELARELITATGDTRRNGATVFYRAAGDARSQAEFVSEVFLGVRLRCANCHDHPLDRWTQDDYHGLAAIFARVRRGSSISVGLSGTVIHPGTGEPATPRLPGTRHLSSDEDGLTVFADWLTSRDNRQFDRAIVNRTWKSLMGRGLVEPVDDLRASNAPSHPDLLDELATEFARQGRRLRPLIRSICTSQTFARSGAPLAGRSSGPQEQFYARMPPHELDPEVVVDMVSDVTGVRPQLPEGASDNGRVVNLIARNIEFEELEVLGRCPVDADCQAGSGNAQPLSRALLLINGGFLNERLASPSGLLPQLLSTGISNTNLVRTLYRRTLTREPDGRELTFWESWLAEARDDEQRRAVAEDFLWALLTCQEFMTCR